MLGVAGGVGKYQALGVEEEGGPALWLPRGPRLGAEGDKSLGALAETLLFTLTLPALSFIIFLSPCRLLFPEPPMSQPSVQEEVLNQAGAGEG